MNKIWILEYEEDGIKYYYFEPRVIGPCFVKDINSATIFHSKEEIKAVRDGLKATKPKIVSVNIVPVK